MILSIGDFFVYFHHLIKGDSEYLLKHNELKIIYKTFTSSKFKYITKDRYITQLFVNKMFNFFNNILICFEFLDSTLFSNDDKRKRVYTKFYIESFLSDADLEIRDKFTKEYIIRKLNETDNPNKAISLVENEFVEFKKKLSGSDLFKVEPEYNFFNCMYHICIFNYESFFSKFDPSFSLKNVKQPVFSAILGSEILNELKDFYYIIASLPKKMSVIESVRKLSSREKGPDAEAFAKKVQQAIDEIYKIIQSEITPDIILNMIRYIDSNPKVKIRVFHESLKIIEDYKKNLNESFNSIKNVVIQQFSESTLQKDIKDLFRGKQLVTIEGYNEALIDLMGKKNVECRGVQGLRITKTFLMETYEQNSKDVVNTFILEGFFGDKDFQKKFSDAFFRVNELKKLFLEKEQEIANAGSNSFKTLALLLGGGTNNEKKIKMTLSVIEERIRILNLRVVEDFLVLGKNLFITLSEYKKTKPEKITNIKEIKGGGNKEFIAYIVNFYTSITKYIKLMKNYVESDSEK
ncbi:MAG: hypothetical protein A2015_07490 [Spirochaetes bacterium GWF1_31_7]|nr:MAG: hypothetical protein A2Y30_02870 [Spirochaetes bacterium GWE1_32_154]OHD47600.1 MAG: hypothetical protein A2Y29_00315 [Spirochaetes bacterium GWE2_31_10]OHD51260.1 MAG: hypothetical protein A2015_07490 [Spirochaetes bacterium GWF1_31_7]HBD96157.1 hypothetical protein [Spirochaetia bacterium]HBI37383.1 hypothetical protein [Spirochaetia bacterium]